MSTRGVEYGPSTLRLGAFLLEEPIGKGAMAEVWRARHAESRVPVAMKVLISEHARNQAYHDSFRVEVQSVARLYHPGIALIFDHGSVSAAAEYASEGRLPAGAPWLAMELAARGALDRLHAPFTWPELKALLLSLLDALAHAHARGVVHRDLKPANVLLGSASDHRPGVKLTDFGLAQRMDDSSGKNTISGTPRYMAPEQFRGEWRDFGPWTDLYALGCLAWELCTGGAPFPGHDVRALGYKHLYGDLPAFAPTLDVPEGLESWLLRLLEKAPSARFSRAADAAWTLVNLDDRALRAAEVGGFAGLMSYPTLTLDTTFLTGVHTDLDLPTAAASGPNAHRTPPSAATPAATVRTPLSRTWKRPAAPAPSLRMIGVGLGVFGLRTVPLVGRVAERDALWGALTAAVTAGAPRVVVLRGAAGNGKSRLVEWIGERAHELGAATVLKAVHGPFEGAAEGLARMAARHLRCLGLDRAAVAARVNEHLREAGVADPAEALALTELIAPAQDADSGPRLRLNTPRERFAVLRRLLARITAERPVLLWLDDVQWGPESLAFASWLAGQPLVGPVLIVCTAQEEALAERATEAEQLAALVSATEATVLPVSPLGEAERAELVRELLGLSGELAVRVEERSGGNPLFAVQLVGDWVARGLLVLGKDGFQLRAGEVGALPDDLHQVWSARVDRLLEGAPASARAALELAAALGQDVDGAEWRAVCGRRAEAPPWSTVERLIQGRLAVPAEDGFSFAHGMIRESLERSARENNRWAAHNAVCADEVEASGRDPERLGRHRVAARQDEAAVAPLLVGARRRREARAFREAQALLHERDQALDRLTAPSFDVRRARGRLERGRIALAKLAFDEAVGEASRAEAAARRVGAAAELAEALEVQGLVARSRGEMPAALRLLREAVDRWRALGEGADLARCLRDLGWAHVLAGELPPAEATIREALQHWEAAQDRAGIAAALRSLGDVARLRLDWDTSADYFERAMAEHQALGNQSGYAENLHGLAEVNRLRGRLEEAEAGYREVIRLEERIGTEGIMPRFNLGLCLMARGRHPEARRRFEEVGAVWSAGGQRGYVALVHVVVAPCAAAAGDWPDFDQQVDAAVSGLAATDMVDLDIAQAMEHAGDLCLAAGERERARRAYTIAREQWVALGESREDARLAGVLAAV